MALGFGTVGPDVVSSVPVARLCLAAVAFAALLPVAAACPIAAGGCVSSIGQNQFMVCVASEGAPRQLSGSYDAATDTLTLTWTAPDSTATPDSYTVYRDDASIGTTTSLTYNDNLASITGLHYYYVKAITGGVASPQSDTLWIVKGGSAPPGVPCDPLVVSIYTYYPFLAYGIRDECLP